jgi:hypothetical protein
VPLFVVGAVALLRIDRPLTRVLVTLSLVPIGFAALAGFEFRFLLVRSLSSVSWGIPLALAALVEWGRRRGVAYAALVLVALAILVVPSVPYALSYDEEVQSAAAYLHTVVEPGDGVIVFPGALSHIVEWSLDLPEHGTGIPGYDNPERQTDPKRAYATVAPGAAFSGRVFVLGAQGTVPALPGTPCPSLEPRTFADVYTVSCRQLTG